MPDEAPPATGWKRAEPCLGSSGEEDEREKLLGKYAFYRQFEAPPPPRARPRLLPLSLALLVGSVAAGVGFTLWQKANDPHVLTSVAMRDTSTVAATSVGDDGHVRLTRGIDPRELPFGGKTARADARSEALSLLAPTGASGPGGKAAAAPKGVEGPKEADPAKASNDVQEKKDKKDTHVLALESGAKAPPKVAAETKKSPRVASRSEPKSHPVARRRVETKVASTRHVPAISPKDIEIYRLKRQAEEELKKKIEERNARRMKERGLLNDVTRLVRARFARCTRIGNLFSREKCKWDVCGGMWGKNGCPSYQNNLPAY